VAFLPNSRYYGLPIVPVIGPAGTGSEAVVLRRLPDVAGDSRMIEQADTLDALALLLYGDGTRFWHIADANSELAANDLAVAGRVIRVPPA
jgi:nucleoid-associated protein YgaU